MSGHISEGKIVVIETRRRWSNEERQQAVEATRTSLVSAVARKFGMAKSLLFRWRKEAGLSAKRKPIAPFVPVRIAGAPTSVMNVPTSAMLEASAPPTPDVGTIEIELVGGHKLRLLGSVDTHAINPCGMSLKLLRHGPLTSAVSRRHCI